MFWKKCEKKGHPYIALMVGAFAVVGVLAVKQCGMQYIKEKWNKLTLAMKNMPVCCNSEGSGSEGQ